MNGFYRDLNVFMDCVRNAVKTSVFLKIWTAVDTKSW